MTTKTNSEGTPSSAVILHCTQRPPTAVLGLYVGDFLRDEGSAVVVHWSDRAELRRPDDLCGNPIAVVGGGGAVVLAQIVVVPLPQSANDGPKRDGLYVVTAKREARLLAFTREEGSWGVERVRTVCLFCFDDRVPLSASVGPPIGASAALSGTTPVVAMMRWGRTVEVVDVAACVAVGSGTKDLQLAREHLTELHLFSDSCIDNVLLPRMSYSPVSFWPLTAYATTKQLCLVPPSSCYVVYEERGQVRLGEGRWSEVIRSESPHHTVPPAAVGTTRTLSLGPLSVLIDRLDAEAQILQPVMSEDGTARGVVVVGVGLATFVSIGSAAVISARLPTEGTSLPVAGCVSSRRGAVWCAFSRGEVVEVLIHSADEDFPTSVTATIVARSTSPPSSIVALGPMSCLLGSAYGHTTVVHGTDETRAVMSNVAAVVDVDTETMIGIGGVCGFSAAMHFSGKLNGAVHRALTAAITGVRQMFKINDAVVFSGVFKKTFAIAREAGGTSWQSFEGIRFVTDERTLLLVQKPWGSKGMLQVTSRRVIMYQGRHSVERTVYALCDDEEDFSLAAINAQWEQGVAVTIGRQIKWLVINRHAETEMQWTRLGSEICCLDVLMDGTVVAGLSESHDVVLAKPEGTPILLIDGRRCALPTSIAMVNFDRKIASDLGDNSIPSATMIVVGYCDGMLRRVKYYGDADPPVMVPMRVGNSAITLISREPSGSTPEALLILCDTPALFILQRGEQVALVGLQVPPPYIFTTAVALDAHSWMAYSPTAHALSVLNVPSTPHDEAEHVSHFSSLTAGAVVPPTAMFSAVCSLLSWELVVTAMFDPRRDCLDVWNFARHEDGTPLLGDPRKVMLAEAEHVSFLQTLEDESGAREGDSDQPSSPLLSAQQGTFSHAARRRVLVGVQKAHMGRLCLLTVERTEAPQLSALRELDGEPLCVCKVPTRPQYAVGCSGGLVIILRGRTWETEAHCNVGSVLVKLLPLFQLRHDDKPIVVAADSHRSLSVLSYNAMSSHLDVVGQHIMPIEVADCVLVNDHDTHPGKPPQNSVRVLVTDALGNVFVLSIAPTRVPETQNETRISFPFHVEIVAQVYMGNPAFVLRSFPTPGGSDPISSGRIFYSNREKQHCIASVKPFATAFQSCGAVVSFCSLSSIDAVVMVALQEAMEIHAASTFITGYSMARNIHLDAIYPPSPVHAWDPSLELVQPHPRTVAKGFVDGDFLKRFEHLPLRLQWNALRHADVMIANSDGQGMIPHSIDTEMCNVQRRLAGVPTVPLEVGDVVAYLDRVLRACSPHHVDSESFS